MQEYEDSRFSAHQRLDLQAEGPRQAGERLLHWIQSRSHEDPGSELLVIARRGGTPGSDPVPVEREVERVLRQVDRKLIDWWHPMTPGSFALKVSDDPQMALKRRVKVLQDDGRTADTLSAAGPDPDTDIPPDLLELARSVALLRIEREELSAGVQQLILREIWVEAQALAMEERLSFGDALGRLKKEELELTYDD